MKIIKISSSLIDVFTGEGWKKWSRYVIRKDYIIFNKGTPLKGKEYNEFTQLLKGK